MEYEEGTSLDKYIEAKGGSLSQIEILKLLLPLLDGLEILHTSGIIHRDIKPSNIYIRQDRTPVLLDFGAARQTFGERTKHVTAILTPGYAPLEQYSTNSKRQGPWSDIYALGAVIYQIVTGHKPVEASMRSEYLHLERAADPLKSAKRLGSDTYAPDFLAAIDWAMEIHPESRPQNIANWRRSLLASDETLDKATERGGQTKYLTQVSATAPTVLAEPETVKLNPEFKSATIKPHTTSRPLILLIGVLTGCTALTFAGGVLFRALDWYAPFGFMDAYANGRLVGLVFALILFGLYLYRARAKTDPVITLVGLGAFGVGMVDLCMRLFSALAYRHANLAIFAIPKPGLVIGLLLALLVIGQYLLRYWISLSPKAQVLGLMWIAIILSLLTGLVVKAEGILFPPFYDGFYNGLLMGSTLSLGLLSHYLYRQRKRRKSG